MHRQAVWRCCTMDNGALCVGTLGMIPMLLWCAGGWGIPVVKGTGTLDMDEVRDQSAGRRALQRDRDERGRLQAPRLGQCKLRS